MFRKAAACLLLAALLCGCARDNETQNETDMPSAAGQGVSFEIPLAPPVALIDQNGYETGSDKIVIFRSAQSGDTFEVRRTKDDAVVYTGQIQKTASGDGICTGRFTEFQSAGEYYIYTDTTGSSCAFRIEEGVEQRALLGAMLQFYARRCGMATTEALAGKDAHDSCHTANARLQEDPTREMQVKGGWHTNDVGDRDVAQVCTALRYLLLSYEINPESFAEQTGLPEGENGVPDLLDEARTAVEWLLTMQASDGGVYGSVLTGGNENSVNLTLTQATSEATLMFTETLARFSHVFRPFDAAFSDTVLLRAQEAWDHYTAQATPLRNSAAFAAAAELYRITGERKYENVLSAYFSAEDFDTLFAEDVHIFYGSVTYLLSVQPVNVAVREQIAALLSAGAERTLAEALRSPYLVSKQEPDVMLEEMCRLAVSNHMTFRHEAVGVMENHLHYLCGRNPDAVDYIGERGEYTWRDTGAESIYASPVQTAQLILMLSAMV